MPIFTLKLQPTYYKMGIFNVTVDFDRYVRSSEGLVQLRLDLVEQVGKRRATRRPCCFCIHFIRHDTATDAAVCRHVDRPRLHRKPETGCNYWSLNCIAKSEWRE